ncbi:hypothetical protein KFK09_007308 [Dendrobium nobile]|uniref:Transposase n=1 Tax=Dendrobium nobile TaxID=94219 RepID=A0A8T3BW45_DENNO|nr:hypothetical protein KFK09_007308 [Dendrobium nobile]
MDKSWINLNDRRLRQYKDGVTAFIKFARENNPQKEKIRCPCRYCANIFSQTYGDVENHLLINGMQTSYIEWTCHGETSQAFSDADLGRRDVNDLNNSNEGVDEIQEILEDIYRGSFMNSSPNKSPDEECDNIINKDETDIFDRLLKDAQRDLYPGSELSMLSALVKLLHIKVLNRWTNKSFNMILEFIKSILPKGETLPSSYYESRKILSDLGLGCEKIHACKNDCALFWKDNEDKEECPECMESRWKVNDVKGKKIPHKILRYFPITSRLQRLFMSRKTAHEMRWHKENHFVDENLLRHPVDSKVWKDFDISFPWFAEDSRNVRLALASDGFNPFGNMSTSYSMWPVILIPYNLPPWNCMSSEFMFITLLIPGPVAPGKEIDVYLKPLIEELNDLWVNGIKTYDSVSKNTFQMHVALLWTINDFPAYGILLGHKVHGYKACPICDNETTSQYLRNKICYMGHRRFLPKEHKWRKSRKFNGKHEVRVRPQILSGDEILSEMDSLKDLKFGKHPSYKKRKRNLHESTWTKKSVFFELPYWRSLTLRHNLDVMHIEKNICDNILGTLLNIEGKTKDTEKARLDLQDMGIRHELHLQKQGEKYLKPPASYTLTPKEIEGFLSFVRSIKFPDSYAANISRSVHIRNGKHMGLKSHDCHVLLQRILPLGLCGYLNKDVHNAISDLSRFFRILCAKTLRLDVLEKLEDMIVNTICQFEMIFPPAFFDIMVHLAVHLPREAKLAGPVQYRWMYPIERNLSVHKGNVRNKARPEGSIAEAYVVNEALTFCSRYLRGMNSKNNQDEEYNDDVHLHENQLSIFSRRIHPFGQPHFTTLSWSEYNLVRWYVLNNCEELKPYLSEHENELRKEDSFIQDVATKQKDQFPLWFEQRMKSLNLHKSLEGNEDLYSLAMGPYIRVNVYSGCIVNGVKFLVNQRDIRRVTQNSGVSVQGSHKDESIDFYGVLTDVVYLSYIDGNHVVLFKCKWFDLEHKKPIVIDDDFTSINMSKTWYDNDPYVLAGQVTQVFYVQDTKLRGDWHVVQKVQHRHLFDPTLLNYLNENQLNTDQLTENITYQEDEQNDINFQDDFGEIGLLHREDVEPQILESVQNVHLQPTQTTDFLCDEDEEEEYDATLAEYFSEDDVDVHINIDIDKD